MLLKQPFKSFNLTPESRRSASPLESYAQMKISNFEVGWAIILKLGICEPNKNTQFDHFLNSFDFIHQNLKSLVYLFSIDLYI
jgi:hypothetical protein